METALRSGEVGEYLKTLIREVVADLSPEEKQTIFPKPPQVKPPHSKIGSVEITDEMRTYLIGKQYEHRKNCHGGDRRSSSQNDHLKTSEQIAEENNTSPKSVQRAETYAKAVDTLSDIHGEEVKEKILSGEIRASDIKRVGELSSDFLLSPLCKATKYTVCQSI